MAAISRPPSHHASLIFSSVFPRKSLTHTTPTPLATPDLGSSAPGEAFGGFSQSYAQPQTAQQEAAALEVKRTLAWSTATRLLSLPREGDSGHERMGRVRGKEGVEAIGWLMFGDGRRVLGREAEGTLVEWYQNEVSSHFSSEVKPQVQTEFSKEVPCSEARTCLEETAKILEKAQMFYMRPFDEHIVPVLNEGTQRRGGLTGDLLHKAAIDIKAKFRREMLSMFAQAINAQRFSQTLAYVLYEAGCSLFQLHDDLDQSTKQPSIHPKQVQKAVITLLKALQQVGLGDEPALRVAAHAVDKLMSRFIKSDYMKVDWISRSSAVPKLRHWICDGFAPFARMITECLGEQKRTKDAEAMEAQQWLEMAVGRLGRSRVANLFDYVVHWDKSAGAIEDLKEYISSNADRAYLVVTFDGQLHRRLLKPGVTTTHILDTYISIIRAFRELDPKGVLLDRVGNPVRRYLKERTDAARIIVSSLLADTKDTNSSRVDIGAEISERIAAEMFAQRQTTAENDNELNWNDPDWTPEPHDASSDYKSSKGSDVLSHLLSLFDQEHLITELKNILGDHLLKNDDSSYEKEIRLLELFKLRMGDAQLQPCDVMLRDVIDSKRLTGNINTSHPTDPPIQAQIVSSFFWPQLREEEFKVPPPVAQAQEHFAAGFRANKDMRKLHWLPALGKVQVELELEDRTVSIECSTWQASVIYAFQRVDNEPQRVGGVSRTTEYLEQTLEMDEDLVSNAIAFWIGERVLAPHPDEDSTFVVLERLTSSTAASAAEVEAAKEAAASGAADAGVVSADDLMKSNRGMYETLVVGMLTNQGGMSVPRMLMMLKMVVPGGFPGGEEEVGEVLEGLKGEGKVDKGGGDVWAVVRK